MTTRIVRIGNTLTVEVPEDLLIQASLPVGEPVEWVLNGSGGIALVKPSSALLEKLPKRMTLEELLEGVEDGTTLGEFDWGSSRGAEVW